MTIDPRLRVMSKYCIALQIFFFVAVAAVLQFRRYRARSFSLIVSLSLQSFIVGQCLRHDHSLFSSVCLWMLVFFSLSQVISLSFFSRISSDFFLLNKLVRWDFKEAQFLILKAPLEFFCNPFSNLFQIYYKCSKN